MGVFVVLVTLMFPVEYMERGDTYLESGNYIDAIADYRRVIEMLPKAVDARIRISYVYLKQGNNERAYEMFEDAISIFPEFAEYDFMQRIKRNPRDPDAHYGLGLVYLKGGSNYSTYKAMQMFNTVIALDPGHADAHRQLWNQ